MMVIYMAHEINVGRFPIRTDLISDTINNYGVSDFNMINELVDNIKVERITLNADQAKRLNKKIGYYATITFEDVTDSTNQKKVMDVLVQELKKVLEINQINAESSCLIIGLGNVKSTPDALGPKTIDHILVTSHLFKLKGATVEKGIRDVAAFVPGVMGTTGIETKDIILGLIDKTKPQFVIIIDALASSTIDRVNKTIQITDAGIEPGSGVGNMRSEISKETINIPVIAIGIPTVVDAVTIVSDALNYLYKNISYKKETIDKANSKLKVNENYLPYQSNLTDAEKQKLLGIIGTLDEEEVKALIFEVLTPINYNLMVTPKEIDFLIDKLSLVLGRAINKSLHQNYQVDF